MNSEKSYADYETDLEIQKYFDPGYSGVCIDIGAGVGMERSNTYYFEKKYWRCLCIEPNPKLYNHMRMYRRLALNVACSNYDKKNIPFYIYDINDGNQEAISSLTVDQRLVESHKEMRADGASRACAWIVMPCALQDSSATSGLPISPKGERATR